MNQGGDFAFLEHTADVMVKAWGKTLEEALKAAAKAMFEVITDTSRVRPLVEVKVEVCGTDLENLLYRWLEELLYHHDTSNMVFSSFNVSPLYSNERGEVCISGSAAGEPFDRGLHEPRTVVKAVTYHNMRVWREGELYYVTFVLDI